MRTKLALLAVLAVGGLASTGADAQTFMRNGQVCQRASSGYIVCREPGDRYSNGYVAGRGRAPARDYDRGYERGSDRPFYRNGDLCQRASSGYVICRNPRDRYSQGYVLR